MLSSKRKSLIAGILALSMLGSACAKQADAKLDETVETNNSYMITGGTVEEPTGEVFYTSTRTELSLDALEAPDGYGVTYRFIKEPVFVGDRIILEVFSTYSKKSDSTTSGFSYDEAYDEQSLVLYDLQGRYRGSFSTGPILSYGSFYYDVDSNGNIVAFCMDYESTNNICIMAMKFTPDGEIVQSPEGVASVPYADLCGARVTDDGDYWLFTETEILIVKSGLGEEITISYYPTNTLCVDMFEENGAYYAELISFADDGSEVNILAKIEDDGSIIMSAGKNADNLIGMKTFQTNGGLYAETKNAFGKLSLESGEFSQLVDWNQTDVDRSILVDSNIKVVSEGKVTQTVSLMNSLDDSMQSSWGQPSQDMLPPELQYPTPEAVEEEEESKTELYLAKTFSESHAEGFSYTPVLYHLVQSDTNPHSGQQVVWIGGINLADSVITQYVAAYNSDLSNPAWVKIYDYGDFEKTFWYDQESDAEELESLMAQMNSGVGPDIVFGTGDQGIFENSNYLTDLNPYMDGIRGIDREEYFDNIFEAYETGGSLYQMPVAYELKGSCVNRDIYDGGMSFDELNKLSSSIARGTHVLPDWSIEDVIPGIVPSAFSAWIDYANNSFSVPHSELVSMIELFGRECTSSWTVSWYTYWSNNLVVLNENPNSLELYAEGFGADVNGKWYGVPGPTSDAPTVHAQLTMGIASYSTQKEQAWDFIRYLLSEDVQTELCTRTEYSCDVPYLMKLPVNRAALKKVCEDEISNQGGYGFSVVKNGDPITFSLTVNDATLYDYINLVEKVHMRCYEDPQILEIVTEALIDYIYYGANLDATATTIETKIAQLLHDRQS